MLDVAFYIDEMTMRFKGYLAGKRGLCKNQKVMDYRHMIFVRKDIHIKYLCEIILCQKHIYLKGCCQLILEQWPFLIV